MNLPISTCARPDPLTPRAEGKALEHFVQNVMLKHDVHSIVVTISGYSPVILRAVHFSDSSGTWVRTCGVGSLTHGAGIVLTDTRGDYWHIKAVLPDEAGMLIQKVIGTPVRGATRKITFYNPI